MRRTLFAGLTQLDPLDPLSTDDYSFQAVNPDITDRLLEVGAVTHRHDAHPALADPTPAPGCTVIASGGQVPGGITFEFAYTLVDPDRGETAASPICSTTTPPPISAPVYAPVGSADYAAGSLSPDAYYYATTWVDADGGETTLGAIEPVDVDPFPNARVLLSGLASGIPVGAVAWRLYRARGGESFHYLASGAGDTITDDGTLCQQCQVFPPEVNTTTRTATLQVTIPTPPSGAAGWRLYGRSQSGVWPSVAYMGSGTAGQVLTFATFAPVAGRPPARSLALRGARQIDPDTDILDWHWKRPVATAGDLPLVGNGSGDVRARLDTGGLSIWLSGAWQTTGGGGGGGGGPELSGDYVGTPASGVVPTVPDGDGVRRLSLDFDVESLNTDDYFVDDVEVSVWLTHGAGVEAVDVNVFLIPPQLTIDESPRIISLNNPSNLGSGATASGRYHVSEHGDRDEPFLSTGETAVGIYKPSVDTALLAWRGRQANGHWTLLIEDYNDDGACTLRAATLHFRRRIRREGHTFTIMGDVVASGTMAIPVMPVAAHPDTDARLVKLRHKLASGAASGVMRRNGTTIVPGLTFDTGAETVYAHEALEADDELELVITSLFGSPKGLSCTVHLETNAPPGPIA